MSIISAKRLSQLSISLLTAGALLTPALSMANAATAPTPAAVTTQEVPGARTPDEGRSIKSMFRTLDLTEEQKAKINPIVDEKKQAFADVHKQMQENRKAMNEVVMAKSFDAGKAKTLANQQGELVSQMALTRAELMSKVYHELTPEQQTKFRAMQEERANKPHR